MVNTASEDETSRKPLFFFRLTLFYHFYLIANKKPKVIMTVYHAYFEKLLRDWESSRKCSNLGQPKPLKNNE